MASIIPNTKEGKIVSYKFKVYAGRDEFGKQVFRCTTWQVPEGIMPSRVEKGAQKAAAEWERQVEEEYKKDLQNPERVEEREIEKIRTEFAFFVKEIWYPICICNGEHKPTTTEFYRHISNVIADYFSGRALQSVSPTDIDAKIVVLFSLVCYNNIIIPNEMGDLL